MATNIGLQATTDWQDAVVALSLMDGDQYSLFNNGRGDLYIWVGPSGDDPVQQDSIVIHSQQVHLQPYQVATGEGLFIRTSDAQGANRLVLARSN